MKTLNEVVKDKTIGLGLTETQLKMWAKLDLISVLEENGHFCIEEDEIDKIKTIYRKMHYQGMTLEEVMEEEAKETSKKGDSKETMPNNETNFILFQNTISELGTHLHSLDNKVNEIVIGKNELKMLVHGMAQQFHENRELKKEINEIKQLLLTNFGEINQRERMIIEIKEELKKQTEDMIQKKKPFWEKWFKKAQ